MRILETPERKTNLWYGGRQPVTPPTIRQYKTYKNKKKIKIKANACIPISLSAISRCVPVLFQATFVSVIFSSVTTVDEVILLIDYATTVTPLFL